MYFKVFVVIAILGAYFYTWWVHTEYLADIENMEQHLQTDINVIGRELEEKVVEKFFTRGAKGVKR